MHLLGPSLPDLLKNPMEWNQGFVFAAAAFQLNAFLNDPGKQTSTSAAQVFVLRPAQHIF